MTGNRPVRNGPGQKSRLKITNAQNDARYVALGRTLFLAKSQDHDEELKKANRKKNGHPFLYPELLILSLATIRIFCGLSFRVLEGLSIGALGEDSAPSFSQIRKRMKSIKLSVKDGMIRAQGKKSVLNLSIDGTGLSPNARSEYIRYKHKVRHGFIRLTLVVDTDTREILGFSVTDDTIGEAPQFERLTCTALENAGLDAATQDSESGDAKQPIHDGIHTEEGCAIQDNKDGDEEQPVEDSGEPCQRQKVVMRADGGFDSRKIFQTCKQLGITPYIRISHNATTRSRGVSRDRTMAVIDQLGDGIADPSRFAHLTKEERESNRKKWKTRVKYGLRWLVEIVISSFKRLFGDSVAAKKWENVVQEISLKIYSYNRMLCVQSEAIAMA